MQDADPASTPTDPTTSKPPKPQDYESFDATKYRTVVGSLQYLCVTRPDISFAVNKAAKSMHSPTVANWVEVKRILQYLAGTLCHGIYLWKCTNISMNVYCDADLEGDKSDRKFTTGFTIFSGPNLISWSSRKQKLVFRSSTEFKYRALATAMSDLL